MIYPCLHLEGDQLLGIPLSIFSPQSWSSFIWTFAIVAEWVIVLLLYSRKPNHTAAITREGPHQWEITNPDRLRRAQVLVCFWLSGYFDVRCVHRNEEKLGVQKESCKTEGVSFSACCRCTLSRTQWQIVQTVFFCEWLMTDQIQCSVQLFEVKCANVEYVYFCL